MADTAMMCSPTRASLMTGRLPIHVHQNNNMGCDPPESCSLGPALNMAFLPTKLREAGYLTHMIGKHHLGNMSPHQWPIARGFDHSLASVVDSFQYYFDNKKVPPVPLDPNIGGGRDSAEWPPENFLTAEAEAVIDRHRHPLHPMFLFMR